MTTAIQLRPEIKARLDEVKVHPRETYDETINCPGIRALRSGAALR